MYTPIVIFAFNRLDVLKNCILSLQMNAESRESDLFVFVDGARPHKKEEKLLVKEVQDFVKTIKGFKSLHYQFSEKNKGLAPSVISGVTNVINQYGKAIVVEEDLIVSRNFLAFMNEGLAKYEDEKSVFSICGYTNIIKKTCCYPYDAYFCTRSSSWGWATWKDRWDSVDWELKEWNEHKKNARKFNKWGGSDCWKMLKDCRKGKNSSWAIRFCYSQFVQNKVSLFPIISHVKNDGFDGQGTNCKHWSRFKSEFDTSDNKVFSFPEAVSVNEIMRQSALSYHSIWKRIYSRIMYVIYK